jgi:hypothetical protein
MGMSRITVHIDRLVLPPMAVEDRKALIEGLRGELVQALSQPAVGGGWVKPYQTAFLSVGRLALKPGPSGSREFGSALARSIGRRLRK